MNMRYKSPTTSEMRRQRSYDLGPTDKMTFDLKKEVVDPITPFEEIVKRYARNGVEATSVEFYFREACRRYSLTAGSVLIMLDRTYNFVGQVDIDDELDDDNPKFQGMLHHLFGCLPPEIQEQHRPEMQRKPGFSSLEFPIYIMPRYNYAREDGPIIESRGDYFGSFWAILPSKESCLGSAAPDLTNKPLITDVT